MVVSVIAMSDVYMVLLADIFILGTEVNLISILGIVLVVTSSLVITINNILQKQHDEVHEHADGGLRDTSTVTTGDRRLSTTSNETNF